MLPPVNPDLVRVGKDCHGILQVRNAPWCQPFSFPSFSCRTSVLASDTVPCLPRSYLQTSKLSGVDSSTLATVRLLPVSPLSVPSLSPLHPLGRPPRWLSAHLSPPRPPAACSHATPRDLLGGDKPTQRLPGRHGGKTGAIRSLCQGQHLRRSSRAQGAGARRSAAQTAKRRRRRPLSSWTHHWLPGSCAAVLSFLSRITLSPVHPLRMIVKPSPVEPLSCVVHPTVSCIVRSPPMSLPLQEASPGPETTPEEEAQLDAELQTLRRQLAAVRRPRHRPRCPVVWSTAPVGWAISKPWRASYR